MRASLRTVIGLLAAILAAPIVIAQSVDDGSIAIRCGSLIDGTANEPMANKTVVIVDGRVKAVTDTMIDADVGADADEVLDLGEYTCLPGLIDTHTHIAEPDNVADLEVFYTITTEEIRAASDENSTRTLSAGFTTVRNLGSYVGWSARELRDRINRGELPGPRILAAGFYLTMPAGGGDLVIPGHPEEDIPPAIRLGVSQGVDQYRRNAEKAVAGGADVLKVIASGAVLAFGGVPGAPEMTREEIAAVVEVAHDAGIKVTAHAHGAQSIKDAIAAGVDSVEHASLADDDAIAMAVEYQVAFSMDVYNGSYIATVGKDEGWPAEFLRKNDETTEAQRQVFEKAYAAGVSISYGTDAGVYPNGDNGKQFAVMVERGMSAMDAIKAATSVAADVIGWEQDVGALVKGRYGDLIAVKGDPLTDISELEHVDVVVKGGRIFKQQ